MKKIALVIASAFVLIGGFFAFKTTEQAEWTLDKAHGKLGFSVTHLMVSDVDGRFRDFDAKIVATKEDFSDAVATMTARVNSIDTDNDKRDADLKGPDYFNAAKYPTISFKSTSFTKIDKDNYKVVGDLTIHGITKKVELNALSRMGNNPQSKQPVAGFKVTGTIKRLDFGVGLAAPAAMIGNEVDLVANVEFGKSPLP